MTVHCSQCGEPLMGAVNRCWRCGHWLGVVAGESELPPIRRKPVQLKSPEAGRESAPAAERALGQTSCDPSDPISAERITPDVVPAELASTLRREPVRPNYPKKVFAESCAITSVVVGVLTGITSILTVWAAVPALVGIALGVIGIGSDRRRTAAVGIVLCCLAFLVSAGRASLVSYRAYERRQNEIWGEY